MAIIGKRVKVWMIYFTSDLHFGHNKNFIWASRGFSSIEEHDRIIIDNINKTVKEEDELYILGDIMLEDNNNGIKKLQQIHCKNIYIILGNHCTDARKNLYDSLPNIQVLGYSYPFKYRKWHFMLSHYPMITSNYDDNSFYKTVYNLCGHSHIKELFDEKTNSYHVELDAHQNYPVNIDDIIIDIKNYFSKKEE